MLISYCWGFEESFPELSVLLVKINFLLCTPSVLSLLCFYLSKLFNMCLTLLAPNCIPERTCFFAQRTHVHSRTHCSFFPHQKHHADAFGLGRMFWNVWVLCYCCAVSYTSRRVFSLLSWPGAACLREGFFRSWHGDKQFVLLWTVFFVSTEQVLLQEGI